ncbi:protein kinase domain-containing protein [Nocardiopsis halotolerans]|uniref:protein kinase domain-containing protein n=1 Tax=Nocardiopsis halotolerans TaxID=124252 RepID=UPI000346F534|nr:protein kinase [Nocardiopsis halotolerans]
MSLNLYVGPDPQPDKYRLVRSVGRGGEATLYLAEVSLAGQTEPVVVKVLNSDVTANEEQFAELSAKWGEQAELLRFINRLGVVGVREHFEGAPEHPAGGAGEYTDRALYLVMNYVEGVDLRDWRAEHAVEGPRGQREALRYLEQIALVLDMLHSGRATPSKRVVVHGDLSPGNIMISEEGQATLVDFGLSRIAARHMTARPWFTPGYAAPEIFNGEYSAATDRYAFGAIAFFTLTGEDPPPTPEQLRERFGALPLVANAGERQRDLAMSMFSAEPGDRPQSSEWIRGLRSLSTSAPWTGPVAEPGGAVLAAAADERAESSAPSVEGGDARFAAPPQGGRVSGPPPESAPVEDVRGGERPQTPGRPGGGKQSGRDPVPSATSGDRPAAEAGAEAMPPRPVGGMRGTPTSHAVPPRTSGPQGGQPAGPPPGRPGPPPGGQGGPVSGPQGQPPHAGTPPQGTPPRQPMPGAVHSGPVGPARTGPVPAATGPQPGWGGHPQPHATGAFPHAAAHGAAVPETDGPGKRGSRKPRLVGLAILVVLAMVAGGTATFYVMDRFGTTTVAAGDPGTETDAAADQGPSEDPDQGSVSEPTGQDEPPTAESSGKPGSEGPTDTVPETTLLTQMEVVDGLGYGWAPDAGRAELNGEAYSRALVPTDCGSSECTGWVDYNLGRDWTTFTATIGIDDTSSASATTTFTVHVDGEAEVTETLRLGETLDIEVDVTDALRLRLAVESDDEGIYPVWADPALTAG